MNEIFKLHTSKHPPLRTKACEHINITRRIIIKATPVGFATPGINPNICGRSVNNHSTTVRFFWFIIGSFITYTARKMQKLLFFLFA